MKKSVKIATNLLFCRIRAKSLVDGGIGADFGVDELAATSHKHDVAEICHVESPRPVYMFLNSESFQPIVVRRRDNYRCR